ncbi:hypothetical protein BOX15_Mlig031147g1, partial [Macrostomum lignano]
DRVLSHLFFRNKNEGQTPKTINPGGSLVFYKVITLKQRKQRPILSREMPSEGKPKLTPLLIQQQQHRQPMDSPAEAEASNPAGANNTELLSPVEQQTIRLGGNTAATSASGAAPAEADGGDGEEVAVAAVRHRRTRGRQSLKRLSDIMSAYIPVNGDSAQQQQHRQDRRPLLESHPENDGGEPDPAPSVSIGCGPRLVKLLDLASLCCSQDAPIDQSEAAEPEDPRLRELAERDLAHVAVSAVGGFVFLAFADSPSILRLQLQVSQQQSSAAIGTPIRSTRDCRVIEIGPLRNGARLGTIADLKVRGDRLYISACVTRPGQDGAGAKKGCVIARCDLDGRPLLVSKELPYPKFLGFDVDSGGELVVASQSPPAEAQVFRMSSDFRRKLFKIQLGGGSGGGSVYKPDFVACMSGGNTCWVATEQLPAAGLPPRHRLLSFPLRPQQQEQKEPQQPPPTAKSWLKVSSWKLDQVRPGRLLAVPSLGGTSQSEKLLMLSREHGNILCLGGQQQQLACNALTHPVSDGGHFFTSICCCPAVATVTQQQQQDDSIGILATSRDSLYLLQGALA